MTSIQYTYNFFAGYFNQHKQLIFDYYDLVLHLSINDISDYDQDIAFSRIDLMIYEMFDNAIFINENDLDSIDLLIKTNQKVITFPEPGPIDQIVQIVILSKLNAVTEFALDVYAGELTSTRGGGIKYIESFDENNDLISNEKSKWWSDPSPSIFTPTKIDNLNFVEMISWKDFDLQWEKDTESKVDIIFTPENEPDNIIKMPVK